MGSQDLQQHTGADQPAMRKVNDGMALGLPWTFSAFATLLLETGPPLTLCCPLWPRTSAAPYPDGPAQELLLFQSHDRRDDLSIMPITALSLGQN